MEYLLRLLEAPEVGLGRLSEAGLAAARHLKDHFIPHARNNYRPHILEDRALALFSGALVALKMATIALVSWGPAIPALSSAITQENIIMLTNRSREAFGLSALEANGVLARAAQAKAEDMLAKSYFSHTSPDGRSPWDFISVSGYNYLIAGENLAVNFTEAENVEDAWINSPGHKANILNKNFEEIGIGISQGQFDGHLAIFVVQMFGSPSEQKVALTDKPTPVQAAAVPPPPQQPAGENAAGVQGVQTPQPEEPKLSVQDAKISVEDGMVNISAAISGDPVKAYAYFGDRAVMLSPKAGEIWAGEASLKELAEGNLTVRVKAFDIRGGTAELQLANFTNGTIANFDVVSAGPEPSASVAAGSSKPTLVELGGRVFDPKTAEGKFYLFFVAGILASMVLAIGIKRHVQHLGLIANGSLVAIFAMLLWMAG